MLLSSSLLLFAAAASALANPHFIYEQTTVNTYFQFPSAKEQNHVLNRNWLRTLTHPSLPGYAIRVKQTSPLCDPGVIQYTGYLDTATDKHFFFWFFESRDKPKSDPMILWLNGGPGCSSMTGLLSELGPCQVTKGGNATEINKYSWNNNANIIFLDQPLGAGFSYGSEASTTVAAAEDMYAFFQLFYQEFPEYYSADLHITGESYAGHYIPQVAAVIVKENERVEKGESDFAILPLASVAIGNGLTDPLVQYKYYGEYACNNPYGPVVSQEDCNAMTDAYESCARLIKLCYKTGTALSCLPSSVYCNNKIVQPFQKSGKNVYDVRRKCESNNLCYEIMEWMETYLNKEEVRWELGVGERKFKACNMALNSRFQFAGDWMRPYVRQVPVLLEAGIRVLIYAGDADFICNYMGNKAWTLELEWPGQADFNAATDKAWPNKDKNYGEIRSYGNFTYLRVYGAGHMVPMDQPEASSMMINRWMDNQL